MFRPSKKQVESLKKSLKLQARLNEAVKLVKEQAEDKGIWFKAKTAPEAYLQQKLRKLHICIEGGLKNRILESLTPTEET